MKDIFGANKIVPLIIAIFILSFITMFLIVEFRFLKQTIGEYQSGIQKIATNKTTGYLEEIRLINENWAHKIELQQNPALIEDIPRSVRRAQNVYLLDSSGSVIKSLSGKNNSLFPHDLLENIKQKNETYIFAGKDEAATRSLLVSTPVAVQDNLYGFLVVDYSINNFKKEIFLEFMQPNYKVALFDQEGRAVIWPFDTGELERLNPRGEKFSSDNIKYKIQKTPLEGTSLNLYFFTEDDNFDTYRIITMMFLLFALYFCIYQFLVEFWQANSAKSYFENIDFDILNHLQEGIIITNRFNTVIFANRATHDFFPEKEISFKKSNLKDLLGHVGESNKKFTLKKWDKSLEIIRSPIFKDGKILGSLVVISESIAKEKLCALVFNKLVEIMEEGVLFITSENKIETANMMVQYYLGPIEKGMDINDLNPELAGAIQEHTDPGHVQRVSLAQNNLTCELLPVYNEPGVYAGTLVFMKDPQRFKA